MAYVYKPKGRKVYLCRFKDPATGRWMTRSGYSDKTASKQLAARLEREAAQRKEGVLPPEYAKAPIAEHVGAFIAHLRSKDGTAAHVALRRTHIEAAVAGCGWTTIARMDGSTLELWLAGRREDDAKSRAAGEKGKRFSARTSNHYLQSLKHFARWCVRTGRLAADPFAHVEAVNVDTDRRRERRALEPSELTDLVAAAREGKPFIGLTGRARAALYLAATYTGLRASELASLIPSSFNFEAKPPTWSIAAADEKARRGDSLPLHPILVAELRAYVRRIAPGTPLWPGCWARVKAAARMLRRDLKAAGIAYETLAGVCDFHSLRVTFITNLARAGVSLQAAQRLARHCDPRLTSTIYSRLGRGDLASELGKLTGDSSSM